MIASGVHAAEFTPKQISSLSLTQSIFDLPTLLSRLHQPGLSALNTETVAKPNEKRTYTQ